MWVPLVFSFDKVDFHCREHIPAQMVRQKRFLARYARGHETIPGEIGRRAYRPREREGATLAAHVKQIGALAV
jgi:hypothetical protein